MNKDTSAVHEAVAAPLAAAGIIVEDVRAHAAGRFRTLTVVIDLDGTCTDPVSLEHITTATRVISEAIDDLPLFNDHPYELQVTSPGATRPLTEIRHYQRILGRSIAVRTHAGEEFEASLTAADPQADTITVETASGAVRTIGLADIAHAEAVLSFR